MVQNLVREPAQELVQDAVQNPEQVAVNETPEESTQDLKQEPAPVPEQSEVQTDAQGLKQDEGQGAVQNLTQNTLQEAQDAPQESVKAAGIVVNLPGTKARPVLSTVSMRLNPEVKSQLQAMARRRHMSLGEFCAVVMAGVAQAGEAEKTEAA